MGINGVNQQNYNYYNRGVNNNFTLTNSYANAPIFTGVNKTNIDSFQNSQAVVSKDGKDDGSIGFFGAVGNLFKGVGNFFKGMVCDESGKFSWTRTLTTIGIGAAIGVACTMLPAITIAGTAFSTLGLISAGFLGFAGLHAGSAAIDIMSAKTDAEAEQAWQSMGSALTEGGLAYLGYRASGGIFAKDVVPTTPTGSTPKTPKTEPIEPLETSTLKTEAAIEPTKTEAVVETKPIESEVPLVETITEEPVTTTSVAEPIAKLVEKPAMTMTDEARVQYNQTKSLLENTKHRASADAIDEQFATPKELAEIKEYYTELEKTTFTNEESAKIEILKNGTKKITEPIKWTTKDGKQLEYTLIREYMPDESIMYRVVDTDQTVVGEWVGFISKSEKGNYIDGYSLWTDRSGRYTKGLGTELKKQIYKDALEYDCKSIKIKAAWQSHTFHNKMGYKCDITNEYLEPIVATLKLIKLKNTVPEFNKRIEIAINNKNIPEINTLVDDILSYANTNGMRSADIGIKDIMIPMKYEW